MKKNGLLKEFKGLRKESLRDNMDELEVLLANIGETTTRKLAEKHKPIGLGENIVNKSNSSKYEYIDNNKIE